MKNLKLIANCIPVCGAKRSIIYDLHRNTHSVIPNDLYDFLKEYDGKNLKDALNDYDEESKQILDSHIKYLLEKEYIFFTDQPEYYPNLNLEFNYPSYITNCIIDFDLNSPNIKNIENIILQLDELLCVSVQFRFFDQLPCSVIEKILCSTVDSGLSDVQMVLRHESSIDQGFIDKLNNMNKRLSHIHLYGVTNSNNTLKHENMHILHYDKLLSVDSCGQVMHEYFYYNIHMFVESYNKNNCLNRKVSIDAKGNIKNCPSMKSSYGNITKDAIKNVIDNDDFRELWDITKDDIDTCKDCEYRYACLDCRAFVSGDKFSKPKKCKYNPYTSEWN